MLRCPLRAQTSSRPDEATLVRLWTAQAPGGDRQRPRPSDTSGLLEVQVEARGGTAFVTKHPWGVAEGVCPARNSQKTSGIHVQ
jgi:hypothetical protein